VNNKYHAVALDSIETKLKKHYLNKGVVPYFVAPCSRSWPKQYHTREGEPLTHILKCYVCWVILGTTKRKTGFTQDQISLLFSKGFDGFLSSSRNFRSEDGYLLHYGTVEAIRLGDGTVISNRECWSRGFASCSRVYNAKYQIDLSTLQNAIGFLKIRDIEVLDHKKENWRDDSYLIRYQLKLGKCCDERPARYFLNARDEQHRFISELVKPCSTVNEAFECMKPESVQLAESLDLDVKRQGELFFIPLRSNQVLKDIDKHPSLLKPEKKYDTSYNWETRITEILGTYNWIYPEVFEGSQHTATRVIRFTLPNESALVKGTVRHRNHEHKMLKLDNWHSAVRNQVKRSWTCGAFRGGAD